MSQALTDVAHAMHLYALRQAHEQHIDHNIVERLVIAAIMRKPEDERDQGLTEAEIDTAIRDMLTARIP